MKFLITLTLTIVCLSAFTNQKNNISKIEIKNYYDCIDKSTIKKFSEITFDLYKSNINLSNFIGKLFTIEAKKISEIYQCFTGQNKISPSNGTILTKIGLTLLYSSNCSKDVGPALIILDQTLAMLKDIETQWKDAVVNSIVFGMISYQSMNDCSAAAEAIRQIWSSQVSL
jgi:hypothetical protein